MAFLKIRYNDFISSPVEWGSCILNIILCLCMGYFYLDSDYIVPMFYAAFFFLYIIVVFLTGRRFIPLMYMLYCLGGVQNITFINLTGWFIVIGLSWWFPKWKRPMMVIYGLEIFLVCFRHLKSVWHLLAHFAFCVVFYVAAESVRKKIGIIPLYTLNMFFIFPICVCCSLCITSGSFRRLFFRRSATVLCGRLPFRLFQNVYCILCRFRFDVRRLLFFGLE